MSRRSKAYDEQCPRCASCLPTDAAVCTICGLAITVPVQLPPPIPAQKQPEAA